MIMRIKKFPFILETTAEKIVPGDMLFIRIKGNRSVALCVAAIIPDNGMFCKLTLVTNRGTVIVREWFRTQDRHLLLSVSVND